MIFSAFPLYFRVCQLSEIFSVVFPGWVGCSLGALVVFTGYFLGFLLGLPELLLFSWL